MINDAHIHFFSPGFFAGLGADQKSIAALGWEHPDSVEALAERWVTALDTHGVERAALIASLPGDVDSVAKAVAMNDSRFVGFFMLDPTREDAIAHAQRALDEGMRTICLFPAMHRYALHDERVARVFELAAGRRGGTVEPIAIFAHCGVLSVGVRKKLGLPGRFDLRLGDPLGVARLALTFPNVPFIIPHFGAGLFREAMMAADTCANIYLDTSSSNGWIRYAPGLTLESVFRTALSVAGASRLLFGTDSSFFPRGWHKAVFDAQKTAIAALGHTADDEALIFGGNFERLFPLS